MEASTASATAIPPRVPVTVPATGMPRDWAEAIRRILEGPARRVAVLGPRDVGKSTFCGRVLHAAGRRAALLDTDPAQKAVGPPACVTLGRQAPDGTLMPGAMAFVGTPDPLRGWRRLVAGTARLAAEAGSELLVTNTSGLLAGAGRRLKLAKLRAVDADLLVAIGDDPALDALLADLGGLPILRIGRPPQARRKTDGERRVVRQEAFRRHFAGATAWTATTSDLWVEGMDPDRVLLPPRLLLGLVDASGQDTALGILLETDAAAGTVTIFAPVGRAGVAGIRPGRVGLDLHYREIRL